MFVAQPNAKTTVASVLLMLVLAILPPGTWASCLCGPDKCGVSTAESDSEASCCAAHATKSSAKGCCSVKKAHQHAKKSCCCTNPLRVAGCGHDADNSAASLCECSSAPLQQPPTSATPSVSLHTIDFAALLPVAILPPTVELALSPSDWATSLIHAPPIPIRELYCVWRN